MFLGITKQEFLCCLQPSPIAQGLKYWREMPSPKKLRVAVDLVTKHRWPVVAADTYFSEENMNYTIERTQRSHLSMILIFLLSSVLNNNPYNLSGLKESLVSFYTPVMQQSGGLRWTLF